MRKPGRKPSPERLADVGGVGVGPSSSSPTGTFARIKNLRHSRQAGTRLAFLALPLLLAGYRRPSLSYGEGMQLQLRSAISHLNEVWAIENGGLMLSAFADVLPGSGSTMLRAGPTMNRATAAWVTNG